MKQFQSHKIVEAGKIESISPSYYADGMEQSDENVLVDVLLQDDEHVRGVPAAAMKLASKGDYLVRYSDGYISRSPAKAFEEGYTEVAG